MKDLERCASRRLYESEFYAKLAQGRDGVRKVSVSRANKMNDRGPGIVVGCVGSTGPRDAVSRRRRVGTRARTGERESSCGGMRSGENIREYCPRAKTAFYRLFQKEKSRARSKDFFFPRY